MNYEIVVATSNPNKIKELQAIVQPYTLTLISLKDIQLKLNIKETGTTFLENALIKAREVAKKVNKTVIADDSGLQIEVLKGFPGVHSSRFMEGHPYDVKNAEILNMMKIHKNRKAQFSCAMVILYPDKETRFFIGATGGKIAQDISSSQQGFGYDPIFYSDEIKKTFAEATLEEKNEISHRGRAMKKIIQCLLDKDLIKKIKPGRP
jgi:non-canonical purine NTP pyrophosphatase (RdgB/HAM1 family)